jgi:tetratricopeptide (TPR) repeat protein
MMILCGPVAVAEKSLSWLRVPVLIARRRPKTTVFILTLLVLVGSGAGLYGYATYQWRAAGRALQADRPAEARDRLAVCLLVWPRSTPVLVRAARAARLTGDLEGAEALLNRSLKLRHGATEATQLELLFLRCHGGEVDTVAPALLDLVERGHPESAVILETMARAYMHNLHYGKAFACLSRWIEIEPTQARAFHYRGWVRERLDSSKEALKDYEQALALDPGLTDVRLRVAEMLLEDNHPEEALPHLEWLQQQFPQRADVMIRLGHCYYVQGKAAESRQLLEAAVKSLPDDPPLLRILAKLELQDEQPAKAEAWLRRAVKVDPADTEAWYTLASALEFQGRRQEATAALKEHEKQSALLTRTNRMLRDEARQPSNNADTEAELGSLLLRIGQEGVGMHWLNQALQRDVGHQAAHRAYAEYYEKKGDADNAAAHRRWLKESGNDGGGSPVQGPLPKPRGAASAPAGAATNAGDR